MLQLPQNVMQLDEPVKLSFGVGFSNEEVIPSFLVSSIGTVPKDKPLQLGRGGLIGAG